MSNFEDRAIEYFLSKAKDKYLKGKAEHGQGLDALGLPEIVKELEGEIIDMIFYYYAIKEKVDMIQKASDKMDQVISKL
jgi:hypothetical protein